MNKIVNTPECRIEYLRPDSFDYSTRKIIKDKRKLHLPVLGPVNNPLERIREAQSFERNPPTARYIPGLSDILSEEIRTKGIKVNISSDDLVNKLFNKFIAVPKLDAQGNKIINRDTGKPIVETKNLGELLKTLNGSILAGTHLLNNIRNGLATGLPIIGGEIEDLNLVIQSIDDNLSDLLFQMRGARIDANKRNNMKSAFRFYDLFSDLQRSGNLNIVSTIKPLQVRGDEFIDVDLLLSNPYGFYDYIENRVNIEPELIFEFYNELRNTRFRVDISKNTYNQLIENFRQGANILQQREIEAPDIQEMTEEQFHEEMEPTEGFEEEKEIFDPEEKAEFIGEEPTIGLGLPKNPNEINIDYFTQMRQDKQLTGVKDMIWRLARSEDNNFRNQFTGRPYKLFKKIENGLSVIKIIDKSNIQLVNL